ncbi:hypothetical protein N431DRAFT_436017, partial [Stipitochalara longipes BDJ]
MTAGILTYGSHDPEGYGYPILTWTLKISAALWDHQGFQRLPCCLAASSPSRDLSSTVLALFWHFPFSGQTPGLFLIGLCLEGTRASTSTRRCPLISATCFVSASRPNKMGVCQMETAEHLPEARAVRLARETDHFAFFDLKIRLANLSYLSPPPLSASPGLFYSQPREVQISFLRASGAAL